MRNQNRIIQAYYIRSFGPVPDNFVTKISLFVTDYTHEVMFHWREGQVVPTHSMNAYREIWGMASLTT